MRAQLCLCPLILLAVSASAETRRIAIAWCPASDPPQGEIAVANGTIESEARFAAPAAGPYRLELQVTGSETPYGASATVLSVKSARSPFSFFLRDARRDHPIYIPEYGVAVTEAADRRSCEAIARDIRGKGLRTKLQQVAAEPEESFANAAANTRSLSCQTWLGLSRDIRIFGVGERLDWIQPRFHGNEVPLPEAADRPVRYNFLMGRGWGAADHITRRLEDGVLPILEGKLVDDDITYALTAFATLESSPLRADTVRGTHYLVADNFGHGHMFTPPQKAALDALMPGEMNQPEETVLFVRIVATNTARVPRYAFFKNVAPSVAGGYSFDRANGLAVYKSGRVFAASLLNGRPLTQEEAAIAIRPGETATLEMRVPNRPVARERALKLLEANFDSRHAECRRYWQAKLAAAAHIQVPEQRISEMLQAGLLHLDLIAYGREPEGTINPTIGVYTAIGSESSPIIQFMDSMGWHSTARRALTFFLDKQHDDGFIQNFGGYMLETGAALWSIGEHYRYTRDDAWARSIAPKIEKACEYLHNWRARNLRDDLRGKGYGMLEGKTADPEDLFRSFMLNGYAYIGMARAAEMLAGVDAGASARWRREAEELKADIRTALVGTMGRSPVIPLGDGTWCPTAGPWAEHNGPLSLFTDGEKWFTHGAMVSRDSLLGPIYLIFQEVIDPAEDASTFLLNFHNDLMTTRNAAFSQPYYSRHPVSHLRRGEVKPFLKAWYNTVSSLADRQTYTFWEHYFGASPHKTHEEAWFLMDTRWMLYMERGNGIDLLPGVPRAYLEPGKAIVLDKVATYFGPLSLRVQSSAGTVRATVECAGSRKPQFAAIRVPHPRGLKAVSVTGGTYNARTERVRIEPFTGRASVVVTYR
jgi:hypothetical protein